MNINNTFQGITTLIVASALNGQSQGTGFFYQKLGENKQAEKGPHWRQVQKVWLVTNRHVVLSNFQGKETFPITFAFHLRRVKDNALLWEPVILSKDILSERAKFHPNSEVDICAIDVLDLIVEKIKSGGDYLQWSAVSKENLPGNNNIFVEAADDVVVIGYPRSFYDNTNLYPIVKAGIIASKWDTYFNGQPYFLIDAKLFPGSSGSIVISKPKDLVVVNGQILHSKEKQFAFLGIFSGEPFQKQLPIELDDMIITQKSSFNLGIVWYGKLVEEIIAEGMPFRTD